MNRVIPKLRINPYSLTALLFVVALLVFTMCMTISSVDQPTDINAGETFEITMNVEVSGDDDTGNPFFLVVGFLAPRSWNASQNTTIRFESTNGNSTMRLSTPDEIDGESSLPWSDSFTSKFGIGENFGEVEWVTFIADIAYQGAGGVTGTVFIETTPGPENLITQLGYGISNTTWGTGVDNFDVVFTDCVEVKNGEGVLKNLCGPAPRILVEQTTYTFEDLITIVYDAKEGDDSLIGASSVHFCSTATSGTTTYEVCGSTDKSAMQFVGDDIWHLTIWPRSYYGVPEGESIDFLEGTFMNSSGSIEVTNFGSDFLITPNCFD